MKTPILFIFLLFFITNNLLHAQCNFVPKTFTSFISGRVGSITSADIDNDNDLDVLITGWTDANDSRANLYINNGQGVFTPDSTNSLIGVYNSSSAFADIDGDNDPDLVIIGINMGDHTLNVYLNNGLGKFTSLGNMGMLPELQYGTVNFIDVDNDNDQDLYLTGYLEFFEPFSGLYINDGNGNFSLDTINLTTHLAAGSVEFVDFDNDGDKDVIIAGSDINDSALVNIYWNDGNGNFNVDTNFHNEEKMYGVRTAIADINNDLNQDIFIMGLKLGGLVSTILYTNDGNGSFSPKQNTPFIGSNSGDISFADINNDHSPDLFITGEFQDSLYAGIYTNDGTGEFQYVPCSIKDVSDGIILFGDFDNNFNEDLIVSSWIPTQYTNSIINSLPNLGNQSVIQIYPNPTNEIINIKLDKFEDVVISIFNIAGQVVYQAYAISTITQISLQSSPGVYTIQVLSENEKQQFKLVKH